MPTLRPLARGRPPPLIHHPRHRPARILPTRAAAASEGSNGGGGSTTTTTTTAPPSPSSPPVAVVGGATLSGLPSLEAATFLVPPGLVGDDDEKPPAASSWWPLSPATQGVLLLQLCAALFGTNHATVKAVEAAASPSLTAAVRFCLAAAIFAPAAARGFAHPPTRRAGLELGTWLALGYGLQAVGLAHSTAARGALTGAFTIFAVPALSATLGGVAIRPAVWGLAALAMGGVALLTSADGPPPGPADAALVASALLFGVHKWRCEGAAVATAGAADGTAAAAALTGVQLSVMAAAAAAAAAPEVTTALAQGNLGDLLGPSSSFPWAAVAYMGVVTTGMTLRWEVEALKTVPASTAALVYSSELLFGSFFAFWLGGERWGVAGWVGIAAVAVASVGATVLGAGGGGGGENGGQKEA